MDWIDFRLSTRLSLPPETVEEVYAIIADIDAVKNSWRQTNKLLLQTIERLTHSVIVTSTGASNRIEGNRLNDDEVEQLYRNLQIKRLRTRDEQEVAGYLEVLELVFKNHATIPVSESTLLQLHRDMLQHCKKDERQRGAYKFGSNRVEARDQGGKTVGVIFDPTPPHLTPKEMAELFSWYAWAQRENFKHPLIRIANFVFEFLAIHPFQDGNGRASRLLTNLMLLQHDYGFASLVSHERLIEASKADYYLALNQTQGTWKSEAEDISPWLLFILKIFRSQAREALALLTAERIEPLLSGRQLAVWQWATALPPPHEFSRKDAIAALGFPPRTIEQVVKKLTDMKRLTRLGQGRATRYRVISE